MLNFKKTAGMVFLLCIMTFNVPAAGVGTDSFDSEIAKIMRKGMIPGLSIILVTENDTIIKNYGYSDLKRKIKVTEDTQFEIGSCSKAFTALAVLQLEKEQALSLDDNVSKYLPWFYLMYAGKKTDITLKQVLNHTSGIPWSSIQNITQSHSPGALEQTVRILAGSKLKNMPGTHFEYATINYDIAGLIIEKVSGKSFEDYLVENVLRPLDLNRTWVGIDQDIPDKSTGYKIGFSAAREYPSPVFKGNNPAGYIVSNSTDMARWLKIQLDLINTGLEDLVLRTHQPDRSVLPDKYDFSSYAMGWKVHQQGGGLLEHDGLNPNYTAYIGFRPQEKTGVVVMVNSNSPYTHDLGKHLLENDFQLLPGKIQVRGDNIDKACTILSILFLLFLAAAAANFFFILFKILKKERTLHFGPAELLSLLLFPVITLPVLLAIYWLPRFIMNVDWKTAVVWAPVSFQAAVILTLALIGMIFLNFILLKLFRKKNKKAPSYPELIFLSLISGIANAVIIFLITNSFSETPILYLIYYYALAVIIYIFGRQVIETNLVKITFNIIYELRIKLVDKIFKTRYRNYENLDTGKIYATINNDTEQIGRMANIIVVFITSVITVVCAFMYLGAISLFATLAALAVIAIIAGVYYVVTAQAAVFMEKARDTQNVFLKLVDGMVKGFKELAMHQKKNEEYKADIENVCLEFRNKSSIARVKFINAFIFGESLFVIVLGVIAIGFPLMFPYLKDFVLINFVMVLLYLIGPINQILNSIPDITQLRISYNRVKQFIEQIPESTRNQQVVEVTRNIESFKTENLTFTYESADNLQNFSVGPIELEINKGEILFIIGGNGSGKTTLAKMLTGLYDPTLGKIIVSNENITNRNVGEYYSTVFGDFYLFEKLYNVNVAEKKVEIDNYLKLLAIQDKVELKDNKFSTLDLSAGQRKRLALLKCYLEDRPIYLFDEWAADQDPDFRRFFYRTLLPKMKSEGKIVIAVTHDDHYFDVADKIIKLDMGKVDFIRKNREVSNAD